MKSRKPLPEPLELSVEQLQEVEEILDFWLFADWSNFNRAALQVTYSSRQTRNEMAKRLKNAYATYLRGRLKNCECEGAYRLYVLSLRDAYQNQIKKDE
jgi:hypothetical protein